MKISINKIKPVPKYAPQTIGKSVDIDENDLTVGVYGDPTPDVQEWIEKHKFKTYIEGKYTNIIIPNGIDIKTLFNDGSVFEYMDGFSPNLNKYLHIGHVSNLVLCKAFKGLGICKRTVSIYGNTLEGEVTQEDAIAKLQEYEKLFDFSSNLTFMASVMRYRGNLLVPGTGKNEGARVFVVGDAEFVGVRSIEKGGGTTYFYQDVALATNLNDSTLYLTGSEQNNHFEYLKKLFPLIHHVGLGLVKVNGLKMSSRVGNVILLDDVLQEMNVLFDKSTKLIYNVLAGYILKSNPEADKNIDIKSINNPKNSAGLYMSYTMARLNSAGCELKPSAAFKSLALQFAHMKARVNLKPNVLFEATIDHCKTINNLYLTHHIKDNVENTALFNEKLGDLVLACNMLGMFPVEHVGFNQEL